jgi:hypothetical protein
MISRNNEPDGIENATHNTLQQKAGHRSGKYPGFSPDELRVAFSIPSGSLFLVNHPVYRVIHEKLPMKISLYATQNTRNSYSRFQRHPCCQCHF